jgi:oligoendopeptidase F
MNHIVILEASAGELEKILSGIKSMLIKEFDPAQADDQPIRSGDSLYFSRSMDECALRVKATIIRVLTITSHSDEDLSNILKEMQSKLQLTEDQYNYWSTRQALNLVEFEAAHKIAVIQVAQEKIKDRSDWIPLTEINPVNDHQLSCPPSIES